MSDKESVRERVDLATLVGEYLPLRRAGSGMIGRCPFHEEHTASFRVSNGLYHCFGCKVSGDCFSFVQRMEGLEFPDALAFLADRVGVVLQTQIGPERAQREHARQVEQRLRDALAHAQEHYAANLELALQNPSHCIHAVLAERNITADVARLWGLGVALPSWISLRDVLVGKGVSPADGALAGVLGENKRGYFDHLRHRLTIPVRDQRGRVVGFTARLLPVVPGMDPRILGDEPPKYSHTFKTALFDRSKLLFGLDRASASLRRGERAILVEGPLDVIAMHCAGFTTAVASFGTALTEQQARLLARMTEGVVLAFDADEAGERATIATADECFRARLDPYVVRMRIGLGKDADEMLRNNPSSVQRFTDRLSTAQTWLRWWCSRELRHVDRTITGRVQCMQRCLKKINDHAQAVERGAYLAFVRRGLRLSEQVMQDAVPDAPPSPLVDTSAVFAPTIALSAEEAEQKMIAPPAIVEQAVDVLLRNPQMLVSEECEQWIPRLSRSFARTLIEAAREQWRASERYDTSLLMALGPNEAARNWIAARLVQVEGGAVDSETEAASLDLARVQLKALEITLTTGMATAEIPAAVIVTKPASLPVDAVPPPPVGDVPILKERPSRRRSRAAVVTEVSDDE